MFTCIIIFKDISGMKKYIFSTYLIMALLLSIQGCTDTNAVISPEQKPVVEAYLAPGQPVSLSLRTVIGYSDNNADSVSRPIDRQKVQIKVSNGKIFNLINVGNGLYQSSANDVVKYGLSYTLSFTYNGLPISATTTIPERPMGFQIDRQSISLTQRIFGGPGNGFPGGPGQGQPPQQDDNTALSLTWKNPTGEYYFVTQLNADPNAEAVFINNNPNQSNGIPNNRTPFRVNNQPTNSSSALIQPRSFQYFGKYYIILFKVAADYAALYRSGGTSTQNISTPPTSITNGLGIFTGVNADTVIVNVLKK